ncbi:Hpt domain-containing protein [Geothrix sp. 21YS21S-4]|uniref:Hpt domain-containing protein n=1 Tax=Geothrix sp. 21YS21S-4 TaxID=3068889 RepID=UPI0027B995BC|nr:Hpt domain-containing protein [Geothrix sp. 21YS21S-4]
MDSLVRLLAKYAERHAETGRAIREAWKAGDIALAHRLAHTVRGAAGFLGLADIQVQATDLEAVLRPGCGPEVEAPIVAFASCNAELCAALTAAIGSETPEGQGV